MISLLKEFLDFVLHIDVFLHHWVTDYQGWTYMILFAIIFCETGLVVTPILPGDSLLFAAGTISAMQGNPLSISVLVPLMITAAFSGDNTNYFIGRALGKTVYERDYRLIKKKYLMRTHNFFEKHGGKTLIIARFIPIIRTFAPFVAGVGTMRYLRFISFSIAGNVAWVVLFSTGGYFFGNIELVRKNFSFVILAIIFISVLPILIGLISHQIGNKKIKTG
jgi:membrane-associated protein